MTIDNNTGKNKEFYDLGKKMFDQIKPLNERVVADANGLALYTLPPKRPWVGLTEEERSEIVTLHHGWNEYGQAIEAALKEKNFD
jgi:hypothetical protein